MRELLAQIATTTEQGPGTTLVVGAGNGAELPALRRLANRRLVLIEAHPQVATELASRVVKADGEEVWSVAIAPGDDGEAELRVLSNLRYSSLRDPERLFDHGPNLRRRTPIRVPVRSLGRAIDATVTDARANNLLVLDAPGLSVALLEHTDTALLRRFYWVIVHASAVPGLYQDEQTHQRASERLAALGFEPVAEDPDALYPEVVTLYRRDDHRIELLEQSALVEGLRAELRDARNASAWRARQHQEQLEALQTEGDALRGERDTLARQRAELQTELERERGRGQALAVENARLVKDRDDARGRADGLAGELAEQTARADQLGVERDGLRRERQDLAERLHELEHERDEQSERLNRLQTKVESLGAESAALVRDKERLTAEAEQQRHKAAEFAEEAERLRAERDRLQAEKQALDANRDEQAKQGATELIASLDRAEQKLSLKQQRIDQLEYELTESSSRQRLLDEELVKAEAQLELVKDLLLREQTL